MKNILVCFIVFAAWGSLILFSVPTYDFDEAVYRRVAEEMSLSKNWFYPTWDGNPFFHKPPFYYWIINVFSWLLNEPQGKVSVLASRLPSFFFVVGIALQLSFFWKKKLSLITKAAGVSTKKIFPWLNTYTFPVLIMATALFPSFTSSSVLFDPMLSFFLTPSLLVLTLLLMDSKNGYFRAPTKSESLVLSFSLALACITKGPIGIVIPVFAIMFHCFFVCLFTYQKSTLGVFIFVFSHIKHIFKSLISPLVLSLLVSAIFYGFIYLNRGERFFHEFIIVHHFERASSAMEGHSGHFLYHFITIALSWVFLVSLFFVQISKMLLYKSKKNTLNLCFPISWGISVLLLFSFVSTKLPHYILPAWPAFSIGIAIIYIILMGSEENKNYYSPFKKTLSKAFVFISYLMPFFGGAVFLGLALFINRILRHSFVDQKVIEILKYTPDWSFYIRFSCFGVSLLFFAMAYLIYQQTNNPIKSRTVTLGALYTSFIVVVVVGVIMPQVSNTMISPVATLTQIANKKMSSKSCLKNLGQRNATMSLFFNSEKMAQINKKHVNQCEPGDVVWTIAPVWKKQNCMQNNRVIVDQNRHYLLCGPT